MPGMPQQILSGPDRAHDPFAIAIIGGILFSAIILQRFALPMGAGQVPINLFATLGGLALLALTGRLLVSPLRLVLYALVLLWLLIAPVLGEAAYFSTLSLLFAVVLYGALIFVMPASEATYSAILTIFQRLVLVCAIAGMIQFALQFVWHDEALFNWEGWVPQSLILRDFNYVNELYYGSDVVKTNGFFLLEASILSQYLALAIIIELAFFKAGWRLFVYSAALVLTYSGTGLSLLAIALPWLLWKRFSGRVLFALLVIVAAIVMIAPMLQLEIVAERLKEFQSVESSGFARFIGPFWMLGDLSLPNTQRLIFGFGPGATTEYMKAMPYFVHDPTWSKLVFEYGVIGLVAVLSLVIAALFQTTRSLVLSLALLYAYLFLGGMFLDARLNAIILALMAWPLRYHQAMVPARATTAS